MKSTGSSHWLFAAGCLLILYVALSGPLAGLAMKYPEFYGAHLYFYMPLLWLAYPVGLDYIFQYWVFFGWMPPR